MLASLLFPEMGTFTSSDQFDVDQTELTVQFLITAETQIQTKKFLSENTHNSIINNLSSDMTCSKYESREMKRQRLEVNKNT